MHLLTLVPPTRRTKMGAGASREKLRRSLVTLTEKDVAGSHEDPLVSDFWDELWKITTTPEEVQ
jgi:hypothetical protein